MRVLISVSDKNGILDFSRELVSMGHELISTGGTFKMLSSNGLPVTEVSDVTQFPECLDGRVKTLHPSIHGGILAIRDNPEHMRQIAEKNIDLIDMVVVNLYPFKETILKDGVTLDEAVENIDIGGPSMLRAAAKNYKFVASVTDSADYELLINELKEYKSILPETRLYLAQKVFEHTAHYDALISDYLSGHTSNREQFPCTLTVTFEKALNMRYGENPHQQAAFYKKVGYGYGTVTGVKQLHGKELSYNNINDLHGALELLKEYSEPTVVACKHSNPCGVASASSIYEAYRRARDADSSSIFGGVVVTNREVDEKTAREMSNIFLEVVLAPSFSKEAIEALSVKKNIRLLTLEGLESSISHRVLDLKSVSGGILAQTQNKSLIDRIELVTTRKPTEKEMDDLMFTWRISKHVKSNGIAIGKDKQSVGLGIGQVSRIKACQQAIKHGEENLGAQTLIGSVMASDAYFPFPDCVEAAAAAGITAIIQPGGSINDQAAIDACNKHGIAMAFTNMRHFRH